MNKILLEIHEDAVCVIEKLRLLSEIQIDLEVPQGSVLFENILSLRLIEKEMEKIGKTVNFITNDESGQNLISLMDLDKDGLTSEGFVSKKVEPKETAKRFSSINLKKLVLPKFKIKLKLFVLIPVISVILLSLYFLIWSVPKASVKILVNSQPLIKSISIRVKNGSESDKKNKILAGQTLELQITNTVSTETTGEIVKGEKAKGEIKIFNKTDAEKKFKKGTEVFYKSDKGKLKFDLGSDVTVPARVDDNTVGTTTFGEAVVSVAAQQIGSEYNIEKSKSMEFSDYKSSEFVAISNEDFKGGSSKKVKAVSESDKIKVDSELLDIMSKEASASIKGKVVPGQNFVMGSESFSLISEKYNAKVGDESEKLGLTRTNSISFLTYKSNDLNKLLDKIIKELIPDGFVLSSEERNIKVEVLGNSDSSVLSPSEADIQVTLKSYVIPEIKEEELKKKLIGKSVPEAQKVLGGVRNVETYDFKISPSIPFFQRFPKKLDNIFVKIERK